MHKNIHLERQQIVCNSFKCNVKLFVYLLLLNIYLIHHNNIGNFSTFPLATSVVYLKIYYYCD